MYKHLLVPTDGSELSSHAVQSAVAFAKSLGARITFLYVQPDYPMPVIGEATLVSPENREDFTHETRERADAILAQANVMAQMEGVYADTMTEVSDIAHKVIIDAVESQGCDLIFMASHGRRGLASLLIGSETNKVLTHCKTPVLVYREA